MGVQRLRAGSMGSNKCKRFDYKNASGGQGMIPCTPYGECDTGSRPLKAFAFVFTWCASFDALCRTYSDFGASIPTHAWLVRRKNHAIHKTLNNSGATSSFATAQPAFKVAHLPSELLRLRNGFKIS